MRVELFFAFCLLLPSLEASPRRWGGGFGRSSSSRSSWGGFGRRSSSSSSSSSSGWARQGSPSSYPRQTMGSSSSYPRQTVGGRTGGSAGGFVKPQSSNIGGTAGSRGIGGTAGSYGSRGLGGGGFVAPKPISRGTYSAPGGKTFGSATPGHGTSWGTSFPSGVGKYKSSGISKKALGLGIGAGFLGGAALGVAGAMATASVYQRYHEYQRMMYMGGYGGGYNMGFGNNYYNRNRCMYGCPANSFCQFGFCECNPGLTKTMGGCYPGNQRPPPRASDFQPFQDCASTSTCLAIDMNLICNTNLTMGGQGKCQCRTNMRWNTEAGECQIYMDVDCSDITYDTPPSPTILEAVEKAKQRLNATEACPQPKFLCEDAATCLEEAQICNGVSDCPQWETGPGGEDEECLDAGSGEEPQEAQQGDPSASTPAPQPHNQLAPRRQLTNSLLTQIDPKTSSADELREAFCRDVDAYSFEFAQTPEQPASPAQVAPTRQPEHDERPDRGYCQKVPQSVCAVAYDSSSCSGGWKLPIAEGQLQFRFWSSYYKYRNDMDLIAVRSGCTFTGFTDSSFNGNSGVVAATQGWDRWVVFQRSPQYRHLDEDIESVMCYCNSSG